MTTIDRPFGYHDALIRASRSGSSSNNTSISQPIIQLLNVEEAGDGEHSSIDPSDLFTNLSLVQEPVYPDVSAGRNLHRIFPTQQQPQPLLDARGTDPLDGHEDGLVYCHIPSLLRYSLGDRTGPDFGGRDGDTVGGGSMGAIAYAASSAILMGLHHANVGNGVVAPALAGLPERCPLRFTTEILDEGGSGLDAVRALTRLVSSQEKPCALIGAHVSSATAKLASLAAVFDLPVVSPAAMSTTLNDANQYPTFARTHTDVGGFGTMAVSFLQSDLGITKFGMLFSNDAYGLGYADSVLKASDDMGMVVHPHSYQVEGNGQLDESKLRTALQALADTGCNYFIGNFYSPSLAAIMGMAAEYGVAGPGKFWLISGSADIAPFALGGALKLPKGSPAAQALEGNGMYFCEGGVPGLGGSYDTFTNLWKQMGEDPQALEYIHSKQPPKRDGDGKYAFPPVFGKRPHHVVTFSYDGAVGLALSACNAWKQNHTSSSASTKDNMFTGIQHHSLLSTTPYYGASGRVEFRKDFPTRTAESSYFVLANLRAVDHNETHLKFMGSPVIRYFNTSAASTWEVLGNNHFVYPGGTTTAPAEMVPVSENLSTATIVSLALGAILVVMTFLWIYFDHKRRKEDALWTVNKEELDFGLNPKLIGKGSFGIVYLAEYRGTKVAVKQVLPPLQKRHDKHASLDQVEPFLDEDSSTVTEEGKVGNPGLKSVGRNASKGMMSTYAGLWRQWGSASEAPRRGFFYRSGSTGGGKFHQKARLRMFQAEFVKEIRHLSKLRHPNITTTMGAVLSPGEEPMMVMEFVEYGSLFDAMRNGIINLDSKEDILTIIQDIAHGLRFLHSANPEIVHGDLKSKNILIDSSFRAKIADFGLSAKNKAGARGTPYWMSPELLTQGSSNTTMSDIYAFGILLYEVYSGENPYKGEDYRAVICKVCDPAVCKRPTVPTSCPSKIAALMQNCWADSPNDRPSAQQVDAILQAEGTIQGRIVRIEALNKELLDKNNQISSKQAMQLGHFACMSHEIRTPLNCVIGMSSLLEEDDHLDPSQKDSVKMIMSSAKLLRQVVDDVLDFSKFLSGNAEIDIKRTDLQETLATIISAMALFPATEKNQITIETFYTPLVPQYIETDGRRLQQILYNLFSNAIKFSRLNVKVDLSVSVVSRYQNPHLEEERAPLVPNTRCGLCLCVKDYGQGIDKSEFGKLFEPFQQTESGKKQGQGGTGLGLPIVKQLVELLGGSITVDSKVGEWTEFSLQFPLSAPLPDTWMIESKLANCCLWLVSNKESEIQYLINACEHFNTEQRHVGSLTELEKEFKSCTKRCFVCLVQDDLYDEADFDRLLNTARARTCLVTFGRNGKKVDRAQTHYLSLAQVFPSVLMQEIGIIGSLCSFKTPAVLTPSKHQTVSEVCYKQLKILVADDNLVNQKVVTRLLNRIGAAHVRLADNGQIAVDLEAQHCFDIIFLDIQMPVMGGVEACERIVARTQTPPKVIFLSANVTADYESMCAETGASGYLTKPCTLSDLRTMLEKLTRSTVRVNTNQHMHSPNESNSMEVEC